MREVPRDQKHAHQLTSRAGTCVCHKRLLVAGLGFGLRLQCLQPRAVPVSEVRPGTVMARLRGPESGSAPRFRVASVSSTSVLYGWPLGNNPSSTRPIASAGNVCCIAGLLNSSSPEGLKSATALRVFDRRLQVCLLAGEQRAICRQLLADRVEEITELAELVARRKVERDTELTFAEACQTTSKNVNRSQKELRKDTGDEDSDRERRGPGEQGVA